MIRKISCTILFFLIISCTSLPENNKAIDTEYEKYMEYKKAYLLYEDNKIDEAFYIVDKMLIEFPEYINALEMRGTIYSYKGKYYEAISDFEKVIEIDHNRIHSLFSLGNTYTNLDKNEEAIKYYSDVD